jgi:small-conductance mechanosensitive channel
VVVKVARILAFESLFLINMRVGFPLLLINLFTLLLSILIGSWIATEVFGVRLAPVLATSAIFSLVLGLALQDTLGNLFAGVALQFDKPYEIGDWIEISTPNQKWAGQVEEISWRATLLIGIADERITVPNRVVAQAEIANFSHKEKPFLRSQNFKLQHAVDIEVAKRSLVQGALKVPRILKEHPPLVFVTEAHDSWLNFRLIYSINNYGSQFSIADEVITACISELRKNQISIAPQRIEVLAQ